MADTLWGVAQTPYPRRTQSHDDLQAVSALDAAEARAKAALRLAEEAENRASEFQTQLEHSRLSAEVHYQLAHQAAQKPASEAPAALVVRGKGWKFAVPLTLIVSIAPLLWVGVMDYMAMKRDAKEQKDTFASTTKRIDDLEGKLSEQTREVVSLRETVAQLSGYLAGVLPQAGVKVPASGPGAARVKVEADPLPIGAKKRQQVNVRTPVPAPEVH